MLRIGFAVIGAACLLLSAGPAAATSHLPDSIIDFTYRMQIEDGGIDISAISPASETPAGEFLLPVASVMGGNLDHVGGIRFEGNDNRVDLEDWFYDMTQQIITGSVLWQEDSATQFMGVIPMFQVFPQADGTFVIEKLPELARIIQGAFDRDVLIRAVAQFPAKMVPEPGLAVLLGAGLAAAALARRRLRV